MQAVSKKDKKKKPTDGASASGNDVHFAKSIQVFATECFELKLQLVQQLLLLTKLARKLIRRRRKRKKRKLRATKCPSRMPRTMLLPSRKWK